MLVCSDDPDTARDIEAILCDAGFDVWIAACDLEARAVLDRERVGLLIVDVHRPSRSSCELLSLVGAQTDVPVLVLLPEGSEVSADYLELGADDCMTWPASPRELVARAQLRSQKTSSPQAVSARADLRIDHTKHQVRVGGEVRDLPPKEFELLAYLASSPGTAFGRDHLLYAVWESLSEWQSSQTVVEHIYRLRRRLERDPSDPQHILTVRGGYVFKP